MYIILQLPNIVKQNPKLSIAMRSRPATPVSTSEVCMTQIILARNDRRKVGMDPINKRNEEHPKLLTSFKKSALSNLLTLAAKNCITLIRTTTIKEVVAENPTVKV